VVYAFYYINGTLESLTGNNAPITPEGKLTIAGNHVGGEYFKGKIDEFRVWNTALSQLIIKQNLLKQIAEIIPFIIILFCIISLILHQDLLPLILNLIII
jgi:hypothetical protein